MKTDAELMNEFFETNHYASTGVEKFFKYTEDQPRDDHGRFAAEGSESATGASAQPVSDGRGFSGSAVRVATPSRADFGNGEKPLEGLPLTAKVPGLGTIELGPYGPAREAARQYMAAAGLPYNPPTEYIKVNPENAAKIASAYGAMKDDPHAPDVKASYDAMIKETLAQYQVIKATGLKIEPIDYAKTGDPYAASPRLATQDVINNNHLWFFPTVSGFGTDEKFDASKNPLLGDSGERIGSHVMLNNDVFRVVHDYFGHIKEGNGFRADGEDNAWRSHSAMYSDAAKGAMTSETRGQNSWVNYGPYGESNRTASAGNTHFADQKVGLMPKWTWDGSLGKLAKYSPDQPRDDHGRFGEGSGTADTRSASSAAITRYASKSGFAYVNSNLRSEKLDAVAPQVRAIDAAFKDPEQPERAVSASEQNVQRGIFIERDARTPEQKAQDMKTWLANVPADVREAALKNPPQPRYDEALATALESGALKPGDVIRDKAFVSTTTDPAVSFGFSAPRERDDEGNRVMMSGTHVVMDMHVPAGTVHLVPQKGAYGNEGEQIYPRGSGIKITSIEKMPFANMAGEKYPGTDHTYTIHGEYVPPDVSKAASFWIPDHAVDIAPSKLAKYSPDQPRDDHGRFGSGGDSIPLTDKGRQDAQENYDRQRDTVALRGETVARELGFPTDKIAYNSNPPPTFVLNGRTIEYAGAANLKTGDITIYTRNTPDEKTMDFVMSHEIGHQMYQPVVDEFHNELERAADHERIERSDSEGHVRMMPLMTTDGSMRENGVDPKLLSQLKESFPVWSTVGKVDNASTSKELEEKDGVSQYSREWWKAANDGTATRHQAMHETMAEINRVVYESKRDTGKMWGSEEAKQVAPVWRRYYRAYAKAFDMIKGKKK